MAEENNLSMAPRDFDRRPGGRDRGGYIEGDAFISGPAELLKGCELVGNLKYKVLTIEDGAQFSGRCDIIVDE